MKILLTGGNGYIGTHICVELIKEGYEVIILDDLSRSHFVSFNNLCELVEEK